MNTSFYKRFYVDEILSGGFGLISFGLIYLGLIYLGLIILRMLIQGAAILGLLIQGAAILGLLIQGAATLRLLEFRGYPIRSAQSRYRFQGLLKVVFFDGIFN